MKPEEMIEERPEVVRDLVRGIAQSGEWAETHRIAAKVAWPFFRQDEKVVRCVLTTPPNRVSYRMLTPTDEDLGQIVDMAVKAGILTKRIEMRDLADRSFIPADIKAADIDVEWRAAHFPWSHSRVALSSGSGVVPAQDAKLQARGLRESLPLPRSVGR